ncbi:MAG: hypothetical protein KJ630_07825 [Proteobacteria bacterium]|nr:hypothetical protein [Pseudomonadota bacterium]
MKTRQTISIFFVSGLLVLLTICSAHSYKRSEAINEDGDVEIIEYLDDDSVWLWIYGKDGSLVGYELGNPNPDDGSGGGAPTSESIKDLIKRHYHGELSKGVQTNNPFVIKQSSQGKGLAPRWNPSDSAKEYDNGGGSGGSGPGANSGSLSEWVKSNAKRGSNGDNDDDNDSDNKNDRPELGTTGSIQPERINPIPFNSTAVTTRSLDSADMSSGFPLPTKGFNMARVGSAVDTIKTTPQQKHTHNTMNMVPAADTPAIKNIQSAAEPISLSGNPPLQTAKFENGLQSQTKLEIGGSMQKIAESAPHATKVHATPIQNKPVTVEMKTPVNTVEHTSGLKTTLK